MGYDKALLTLPGAEEETFLGHLVALTRQQSAEVLVVVRDQREAASYALPGVHMVSDLQPGGGPLMGIYSGLLAMQAARAVVLAVDMPLLQPALLAFLCTQPLEEVLTVPVIQGIPQVLLALYPRALLPQIASLISQGRRDPRSLLTVAPVRYLSEEQLQPFDPELRSFINVNTPQDLAQLRGGGASPCGC